ncbi:hypothetical protein TVAG_146400 [Trichomonas vaginalis G3]|uniref:Uncharacterized protein n=1 Tax=Trichomonas vaginalis (strain ATCC PRA-98 / G3) TaxID=412133 RepID=A2DKU4_TRIV3|nr:hypothetical protein TVAGG3_0361000 [Trichomonas vaginalis G3]EAY18897.1 hypothetical protein TVAG_146400 [Trichomonas vaginalis G3]KAI5531936.1 hypothetical protein TVAGG3_0361000 [Trichomonas vaginalis G3]|eukprot:XP_001579883.1 hypothetical protein [Trichomonas vaginalis G3]
MAEDTSLFEFQDSDIIISKKHKKRNVVFIENPELDSPLDLSVSNFQSFIENKNGSIDRNLLTSLALKMAESSLTDPRDLNQIYYDLKNQVKLAYNYRKNTTKAFQEYNRKISELQNSINQLEEEKKRKFEKQSNMIQELEMQSSPRKSDIIGNVEDYKIAVDVLSQEISRVGSEVLYLESLLDE